MKRALRIPAHVAFIPDGNRRWAVRRGLPKYAGYGAGVAPGIRLFECCRSVGVEEISIYGFTKENVRRSKAQVEAFQDACVEFATAAIKAGAALRAIGDADSKLFPAALRPLAQHRSRGALRCNLIVNYNWQWDLAQLRQNTAQGRKAKGELSRFLGSGDVPAIDLVVRWGGRRRLSGMLPLQSAYADIFVIDSLWPDMTLAEFYEALRWYSDQEVTHGG